MDILSLKDMLEHEEDAFNSGLTAESLMEAAGEAMAHRILALYPQARTYLILTGKGNNGGDGLVVTRYLAEAGRHVQAYLTVPEEQLGELPRTRLDRLRDSFPHVEILSCTHDLTFPGSDGVVIDALLGVQARGVLRGTLGSLIARLNTAREARFFRTVALDLPTGLAAYAEGHAPADRDDAVVADITLAVGFAKDVLCREALSNWVGRLEVVPWGDLSTQPKEQQLLVGPELTGLLPRRSALSHKNDFGHLVIIAGHPGFTGAPILCAQAAQAMGAGLLSIVTRADAYPAVAAGMPPEAMVSAWPKTGETPEVVQKATTIVIGPGLGADKETLTMLRAALAVGCPLLIDADGLNVLAKNIDLLSTAKGPILLTPHPGEMTRLVGCSFKPDEREAVARSFTEHFPVTLVLKGTRTLVTAHDQPFYLNSTGNPGLSTGGSGDTLSGILGALLAQGLAPIDAARLGVWLHGHAADLVLADRGCEEGITPTLLSAYLGKALVSLRAQAIPSISLIHRAQQLLSEGQPPA